MTSDERYGPGRQGLCGHMRGPHAPGTRLYPCGWRCALHTPNALANKPEPPSGSSTVSPPRDTAEAVDPTGAEHEQDPT